MKCCGYLIQYRTMWYGRDEEIVSSLEDARVFIESTKDIELDDTFVTPIGQTITGYDVINSDVFRRKTDE